MAETKCPKCGTPNDARTKYCASCSELMPGWALGPKGSDTYDSYSTVTDSQRLESIDRSLTTIKRIAIWFLVLSIVGIVVGALEVLISLH